MTNNKSLVAAFSVVLLLAAMSVSTVTAITADSNNTANVTVRVASKLAVDITPSDMLYTGVEPGETRYNTSNGPQDGYRAVEIENIGSQNISQVWLNSSIPDDRPFGSGTPKAYDAGNFVTVNLTGEVSGSSDYTVGYTHVNRKEWNESNTLSYVFTPDTGTWFYGRFRSGDQEHFWAIDAQGTAPNLCDGSSGSVLRVGNRAHNESETGSVDFTTASEYTEYTIQDGANTAHGVAEGVTIDPPGDQSRSYDVLTWCTDDGTTGSTYTIRTRYNPTAADATDLTQGTGSQVTRHLINSTTDTNDTALQPGEHFQVDTAVELPFGVASGKTTPGVLRVFAARY